MKQMFFSFVAMVLFSIAGCRKAADPCEGVSCKNDGICINGACDCPERWAGPDCSRPAQPSSIRLSAIWLTKWPATKPDGTGWDTNNTAPDVYCVLKYKGAEIDLFRGNTYQDIAPGNLAIWNVNIDIEPGRDLVFSLYDEDVFVSDEFMGGYQFPTWKEELGHPRSRDIFLEEVGIELRLDLLYSF